MRRSEATPNNVMAYAAKARGIVNLLGFSGFSEFSSFCGCDSKTVGDFLYRQQRFRRQFSIVARIYEAMKSRYYEHEKLLEKNERKYLKGWINAWIKNIRNNIDDFIFLDSPGKQIELPSPRALRQRRLRAAKKRAQYLKTLEYLK